MSGDILKTNNKKKALEAFNDYPWWIQPGQIETRNVSGGLWGLDSKQSLIPAVLIFLTCGAVLFFAVFGLLGSILLSILAELVFTILFIGLPAIKAFRTPKYTVETEWEYNTYSGKGGLTLVMTERKIFSNQVTLKVVNKPISMGNHVKTFQHLLGE